MTTEPVHGWLSVAPPLLAIALAIGTRQVVLSLLAGIWSGWVILAGGNVWRGTNDAITCIIGVFAEGWQTKVVIFTLLMGSLLILMQRGAGVEGFVSWISRWRWAQTRRGAQLMAWAIGLGVFIESTITCLVVGAVSRPLFDRLKISREKLAYICDSTSAPVCMLIPVNGWGALVIGLLTAQAAAGNLAGQGPMSVFLAAVPLNFYSVLSVLLVLALCLRDWDFGPMRAAERRARLEGKVLRDGAVPVVDEQVIAIPPKPGAPARALNMLAPLAVLLAMTPLGIAITGLNGARAAGLAKPGLLDCLNHASGATAVLWGVLSALVVCMIMLRAQRILDWRETMDLFWRGAGGLVSLAALMVSAFAIGATCAKLGTGQWVASTAQPLVKPALIAPIVFVVSCSIAFATGTSWGAIAIMMPLAAPLAAAFIKSGDPVSLPLVVSAVLGGGVFGDHCSPISDTTIVSSMAACSDHIDHVRTQMPYALAAAGGSLALYLLLGVIG